MKAGSNSNIKWRIFLMFFIMAGVGIAVIVKVLNIQYVHGDKWRALSDSLLIKPFALEAERGNMLTENGTLMATSVPIYTIALDFTTKAMEELFPTKKDSLAEGLSKLLQEGDAAYYKNILTKSFKAKRRYLVIGKGLTYSQLQSVKALPILNEGKYKGGLIVESDQKRIMPFGSLALRTIGYTKDTTVIKGAKNIGLEAYYNNYLKGINGLIYKQRVSSNTWKQISNANAIEPENGKDIVTTLDINLQAYADSALRKKMTEIGAEKGCVILMETKTGKIKAMVNLLQQSDSTFAETRNMAISEGAEPGSTFKLASMLSMFDDGLIDTTDQIDIGNGHYQFYNRTMKDSHRPHKSTYTVSEVMEQSSNVGTARLVFNNYSNAPSKFIAHLKKFHLDKKSEIDLYGESKPFITTPDNKQLWSSVSLPWLAIGYGVTLSPIQTLTFYNAVANDGKMMRPYLVSEIQEDGKTIKKFEPKVLEEKIASAEAIKKAQHILTNVVTKGTGKGIHTEDYQIAGKTGTAIVADPVLGYTKSKYQASFCGYYPAEDPVYSCIVVVVSTNKQFYYGGQLGAPVFKELADKAIVHHLKEKKDAVDKNDTTNYQIERTGFASDMIAICKALNLEMTKAIKSEWMQSIGTRKGVSMNEKYFAGDIMPDVTGMALKDAIYMLEGKGLVVKVSSAGKVKSQSIMAGSKILKGQTVIL